MQNAITPLPVPWQIETGESYLTLERSEQHGTHLEFAAWHLINNEDYPDTQFIIEKTLPDDLSHDCEYSRSTRLVGVSIAVTFKGGVWTKIHPLTLSVDTYPIFKFDLSQFDEIFQPSTQPYNADIWKRYE